jgi:hypothetical protein
MSEMLRILGIVYLFSLANGLALLALERMCPPPARSPATPVGAPELELAPDDGLFARFSVLLVAAAVALAALLERWKGSP